MPFLHKPTQTPRQTVFPGIVGHLIHTDEVTIGDFRIEAGTRLPEHQHPHEQTSTVLEGSFEFTVGAETKLCGPGDVAVIPPNVPHSALALTDCRVLDVFHPRRDDYYAETQRLLAGAEQAYRPIDCGVYDVFEAAIVQRRSVELVYRNHKGETVTTQTRLLDLKTEDKREFVQLPDRTWIRLDRVVRIDGIENGACRI